MENIPMIAPYAGHSAPQGNLLGALSQWFDANRNRQYEDEMRGIAANTRGTINSSQGWGNVDPAAMMQFLTGQSNLDTAKVNREGAQTNQDIVKGRFANEQADRKQAQDSAQGIFQALQPGTPGGNAYGGRPDMSVVMGGGANPNLADIIFKIIGNVEGEGMRNRESARDTAAQQSTNYENNKLMGQREAANDQRQSAENVRKEGVVTNQLADATRAMLGIRGISPAAIDQRDLQAIPPNMVDDSVSAMRENNAGQQQLTQQILQVLGQSKSGDPSALLNTISGTGQKMNSGEITPEVATQLLQRIIQQNQQEQNQTQQQQKAAPAPGAKYQSLPPQIQQMRQRADQENSQSVDAIWNFFKAIGAGLLEGGGSVKG